MIPNKYNQISAKLKILRNSYIEPSMTTTRANGVVALHACHGKVPKLVKGC